MTATAAARDWFHLLQHGSFALDAVANVVTVDDNVYSQRFGVGRVSGIRRKPATSRAFGGKKYVHPITRNLCASRETFVQVLFATGFATELRTSLVRFILPPDLTPSTPENDHGPEVQVCVGSEQEGGEEPFAEAVPSPTEITEAGGGSSPKPDSTECSHVPSSL